MTLIHERDQKIRKLTKSVRNYPGSIKDSPDYEALAALLVSEFMYGNLVSRYDTDLKQTTACKDARADALDDAINAVAPVYMPIVGTPYTIGAGKFVKPIRRLRQNLFT